MTTVLPELPAEVMEALAPAFEAVAAQVRAAVLASTEPMVRRKAEATVRALGYNRSHTDGYAAILRDVFGPEAEQRPQPAPRVPVDLDEDEDDEDQERTCECDGCTDTTCQGECDPCDDIDCVQCHGDHDETYDCNTCHDLRRCCNYCDRCDEHHSDAPNDRYDYAKCDDCDHCRECDHYCN